MKVNREDLLEVLKAVKPGLASKEIIEQATHFIFGAEEVYTYNDRISINACLNIDFGDVEFAIQGKELFAFLEKVKGEEVDMEVDSKKNKLNIKAGRSSASLVINTDIKIPEIVIPEDWLDLPEDFTEAMRFCLFSVSKNMTKLALTCLNVAGNSIESCDNYRMTKRVLKSKIKTPFLLPGSAADQLKAYKPIEYAIDKSWIHFMNADDVIFSCRRVEVKYPDLSKLLEVEGDEIQLPEELTSAIDKAGILAVSEFEADKYITVEVKKNKLNVKGEGQLGWISEEIPIKYSGAAVKMKVNPDHFIDILKHLEQAVISEKTLLFKGENFKHAISLVA